jgi:hypothetical protein
LKNRYSIRFVIGNETKTRKQELSVEEITEAATQGWLEVDGGSIIPWHCIQHFKKLTAEEE